MSAELTRWWERTGNFVAYPELQQGDVPHCVYAAIAGAVNQVAGRSIWTPQSLFDEHQKGGPKAASFDVANTALGPVIDEVETHHHLKDTASEELSPELVSDWIALGGVVVLSLELSNGQGERQGKWHMFSLMALDGDSFQVWDTNGGQIIDGILFEGRGFITESEIMTGLTYPNGWFFLPHENEDTLMLKRK